MRRFPQSLSARILLALMLISLLSVLGLGIVAYNNQRAALTKEVQARLSTVAQLKEEEIARWLNSRRADLKLLAINPAYREYIMTLTNSETTTLEKQKHSTKLRDSLAILIQSRPEYRRIEILDPEGRIIVSTQLGRSPGTQTNNPIFQRAFASPSGQSRSAIVRNQDNGQLELSFGYIIHESEPTIDNRSPPRIGAIIADIDLSTSFFGMINNWPERGRTGRIILVRDNDDEILVLNPIQGIPTSPLRMRYPKDVTNPNLAQRALADRGTDTCTDAGRHVIAAYRPVAETTWGLIVQMDVQEALQPVNQLARQLLLTIILVSMAAWLAAFLIWRRIAHPLSNLIDATQEVAKDNYAVNLRVTHDDEIGLLTRSFQQMVLTLDRRKRELQMANKVVNDTAMTNTRLVSQLRSLNAVLEEKVTDRTRKLSEANKKLTELDQLKSKFVANVSHELRNPVASLKLYLRLLEKSNDQNRDRYITGIANQINWLGKLIENILDVTQLERGLLDVDLTHVNFSLIIKQIIETYTPIIEEANLLLSVEMPNETLFVWGSASRLQQMTTNVLTNAVNYTQEGNVKVALRSSDTDAILIIEDSGIGIAAEDLPHIFDQFYRGRNTQELEISGTGLGLGRIKDIVEIHNGHIEVESQLHEGTRFTIFIPLSTTPLQPNADDKERIRRNRQEIISEAATEKLPK